MNHPSQPTLCAPSKGRLHHPGVNARKHLQQQPHIHRGTRAQAGNSSASSDDQSDFSEAMAQRLYQLSQQMASSAGAYKQDMDGEIFDATSAPRRKFEDFDDLQIDDEFLMNELGLTAEEIEEQREFAGAAFTDPEGIDLTFDELSAVAEDAPPELKMALLDRRVYGPEAVIIAGFPPEEYGIVRAVLDQAGGHAVKVLPATRQMLYESVDEAIWADEQDWSVARTDLSVAMESLGAWGTQRAVLFSGLTIKTQATIVELIEGVGLTPVAAGMILEEDGPKQLGSVMAEAVQAERKRRAMERRPAPRVSAAASPAFQKQQEQRQTMMNKPQSSMFGGKDKLPGGIGDRLVDNLPNLQDIAQAIMQEEAMKQAEEEAAQSTSAVSYDTKQPADIVDIQPSAVPPSDIDTNTSASDDGKVIDPVLASLLMGQPLPEPSSSALPPNTAVKFNPDGYASAQRASQPQKEEAAADNSSQEKAQQAQPAASSPGPATTTMGNASQQDHPHDGAAGTAGNAGLDVALDQLTTPASELDSQVMGSISQDFLGMDFGNPIDDLLSGLGVAEASGSSIANTDATSSTTSTTTTTTSTTASDEPGSAQTINNDVKTVSACAIGVSPMDFENPLDDILSGLGLPSDTPSSSSTDAGEQTGNTTSVQQVSASSDGSKDVLLQDTSETPQAESQYQSQSRIRTYDPEMEHPLAISAGEIMVVPDDDDDDDDDDDAILIGGSGNEDQSGMLSQIQSALKQGMSPEDLKRMIDAAYAQMDNDKASQAAKKPTAEPSGVVIEFDDDPLPPAEQEIDTSRQKQSMAAGQQGSAPTVSQPQIRSDATTPTQTTPAVPTSTTQQINSSQTVEASNQVSSTEEPAVAQKAGLRSVPQASSASTTVLTETGQRMEQQVASKQEPAPSAASILDQIRNMGSSSANAAPATPGADLDAAYNAQDFEDPLAILDQQFDATAIAAGAAAVAGGVGATATAAAAGAAKDKEAVGKAAKARVKQLLEKSKSLAAARAAGRFGAPAPLRKTGSSTESEKSATSATFAAGKESSEKPTMNSFAGVQDVIENGSEPPSTVSSSSNSSSAKSRVYGPEPPPPYDPAAEKRKQMEGLLQMRPEALKALEGRNIKFVDLSKLPSKYKKKYVEYMKQRKQPDQATPAAGVAATGPAATAAAAASASAQVASGVVNDMRDAMQDDDEGIMMEDNMLPDNFVDPVEVATRMQREREIKGQSAGTTSSAAVEGSVGAADGQSDKAQASDGQVVEGDGGNQGATQGGATSSSTTTQEDEENLMELDVKQWQRRMLKRSKDPRSRSAPAMPDLGDMEVDEEALLEFFSWMDKGLKGRRGIQYLQSDDIEADEDEDADEGVEGVDLGDADADLKDLLKIYESQRDPMEGVQAVDVEALRRGEDGTIPVKPATSQQTQNTNGPAGRSDVEVDEELNANRVIGVTELRRLVEAATEQGLDPQMMMAEAMAIGMIIKPSTATAVGLRLPPRSTIAAIKARVEAEIEGDEYSSGNTTPNPPSQGVLTSHPIDIEAVGDDDDVSEGVQPGARTSSVRTGSRMVSSRPGLRGRKILGWRSKVTSSGRVRDPTVDIEEDGIVTTDEFEDEVFEDGQGGYVKVNRDGVVDVEAVETK